MTDDAENKQLVEHCLQVFGKIDILILCAGISGHQMFSENPDLSVIRRLMETNFIGYVSITKFALDSLRQNKGQIIVINSMSGLIGLPFRTAYCASKYAVRGFYEALAIEEPDINILKVYPQSMTGTSMRDKHITGVQEYEKPDWKFIPVEQVARMTVGAADRRCSELKHELVAAGISLYNINPLFWRRSMNKEIVKRNARKLPVSKL